MHELEKHAAPFAAQMEHTQAVLAYSAAKLGPAHIFFIRLRHRPKTVLQSAGQVRLDLFPIDLDELECLIIDIRAEAAATISAIGAEAAAFIKTRLGIDLRGNSKYF